MCIFLTVMRVCACACTCVCVHVRACECVCVCVCVCVCLTVDVGVHISDCHACVRMCLYVCVVRVCVWAYLRSMSCTVLALFVHTFFELPMSCSELKETFT